MFKVHHKALVLKDVLMPHSIVHLCGAVSKVAVVWVWYTKTKHNVDMDTPNPGSSGY